MAELKDERKLKRKKQKQIGEKGNKSNKDRTWNPTRTRCKDIHDHVHNTKAYGKGYELIDMLTYRFLMASTNQMIMQSILKHSVSQIIHTSPHLRKTAPRNSLTTKKPKYEIQNSF